MPPEKPQAQPAADTPESATVALIAAANAMTDMAASMKPHKTPDHLVLKITPWNPTGSKTRPRLKRPTLQNGNQVREYTSHDEEIELWNQLRPGRYGPNRKYAVVRRPSDGAIDFRYACKTIDDRMAIANDHKGAGLAGLLRMCVEEAADRKANPARYANEDLAAE
jgi:hypothetical protein